MRLSISKTNVKFFSVKCDFFIINFSPLNSKTFMVTFNDNKNCQIKIPNNINYGTNNGVQYFNSIENGSFLTEPNTTLFYNKTPIIKITEYNSLVSDNKSEVVYW